MSSLALMRWLEAAPERYDAGMRVITLGRVLKLHQAVAEAAVPKPGARVLEIGCGNGRNLAYLRNRVGAEGEVVGLDVSPEMLHEARRKVDRAGWDNVRLFERDARAANFDDESFELCSTMFMASHYITQSSSHTGSSSSRRPMLRGSSTQ